MKTYCAKPQDIQRDWYVVDASDKVLGRLASAIAHRLRGKQQGRVAMQSHFHSAVGKRFDDEHDVGGAAAAQARDGVEQRLVQNHHAAQNIARNSAASVLPRNVFGAAKILLMLYIEPSHSCEGKFQ